VEALKSQFPASNFTLLAMVLALPALGAFVNGVFGKRLGKKGVRFMALAAIGGSFLASLATFLVLVSSTEALSEGGGHADHAVRLTWNAWRWFSLTGRAGQTIPVDVAFSVDAMSAVMMLVITGVGFLIHLYSTEYMKTDPGFHRFFAYLNLFCFAMLVLVMGDNMVVLFVGWEGVGLCSYLLIGFWFTEEKNAAAGKKAFIVNRIGDFGLLIAMAMLVYYCGSLQWSSLEATSARLLEPVQVWPIGNLSAETLPAFLARIIIPKPSIEVFAATLVGLAIFLGCAGKSAQIPLYVWLPDAMAGPTPVSALIHAATMVTAGVYLVARTSFIFVLSPAAMATVATVGAATALFAASIALLQTDLKKVLAYSTVSQLGFMFIGVGVGAFTAGFFHVFTHAFFKACLFLGAGSVIHAMHARIHDTERSQDMRNMGGLAPHLPITRWTFLLSCLAIAGVPPFAGFWSKDEILWKAYSIHVTTSRSSGGLEMWTWPSWLGAAIYWVGIVAATMTAFYMFRAYFMTFHGQFRGWRVVKGWKAAPGHGHGHEHDHHEEGPLEGPAPKESPPAMTVPLVILAGFAVFAGFFNAAALHLKALEPMGELLAPVFAKASAAIAEWPGIEKLELGMMAPGLLAFAVGGGAAWAVYAQRNGGPERTFARSFPRLYQLMVDKWRIDELYDATVVGMVDALADIFTMADKWIVDGILAKLSAALVGFLGTVLRAFQTGRVQAYSASMVIGLAGLGWFLVKPHADVTIDSKAFKSTGQATLSAAPGLGYHYRWELKGSAGADAKSEAKSDAREFTVTLNPGESKEVVLEVESAFKTVAREVIPLSRPNMIGKIPQNGAAVGPRPRPPAEPVAPQLRGGAR
jgi:NADH-quinone oxidoreductase subunit L